MAGTTSLTDATESSVGRGTFVEHHWDVRSSWRRPDRVDQDETAQSPRLEASGRPHAPRRSGRTAPRAAGGAGARTALHRGRAARTAARTPRRSPRAAAGASPTMPLSSAALTPDRAGGRPAPRRRTAPAVAVDRPAVVEEGRPRQVRAARAGARRAGGVRPDRRDPPAHRRRAQPAARQPRRTQPWARSYAQRAERSFADGRMQPAGAATVERARTTSRGRRVRSNG